MGVYLTVFHVGIFESLLENDRRRYLPPFHLRFRLGMFGTMLVQKATKTIKVKKDGVESRKEDIWFQ